MSNSELFPFMVLVNGKYHPNMIHIIQLAQRARPAKSGIVDSPNYVLKDRNSGNIESAILQVGLVELSVISIENRASALISLKLKSFNCEILYF